MPFRRLPGAVVRAELLHFTDTLPGLGRDFHGKFLRSLKVVRGLVRRLDHSSRRVTCPGQSPQRDRRRLVTGRFCRFRAGVPVMTAAGRKVLPRKMMCQLSGRPRIRKQGIASATAVVRMTTNSSARPGLARPRAGRESALQNCACAEGVVGWSSSSPAKWGVESRESRDSNR